MREINTFEELDLYVREQFEKYGDAEDIIYKGHVVCFDGADGYCATIYDENPDLAFGCSTMIWERIEDFITTIDELCR